MLDCVKQSVSDGVRIYSPKPDLNKLGGEGGDDGFQACWWVLVEDVLPEQRCEVWVGKSQIDRLAHEQPPRPLIEPGRHHLERVVQCRRRACSLGEVECEIEKRPDG